MRAARLILIPLIVALATGCECGPRGTSSDGGLSPPDGGSGDGGLRVDGGGTDSGLGGGDAGRVDGGPRDAGDAGDGGDGGGTGDPCAGVSCDTAPPPYCVNASTARSYSAPGACDAGTCFYGSQDTACALGCDGGACVSSTCATPCANWTQCTNSGEGCDVGRGCCVPCGGEGAPCCVDFNQGHFSCNSTSDVCGTAIGSGTGESYYCCKNAGNGCCEQGGCNAGTCCKCPQNGLNACVDPAFGCGGC